MQLRTISRVALPIITALFITSFFLKGSFANAQENVTETTYYLLTDHLGSVDVVMDDQGNVLERADYLPYGSDRVRVTNPDAPETDYRFTGKEMDDETGLIYYGARYYDPLLARFVSRDPWEGDLKDPQSLNKYSYVQNNPIRFIDPTGMYIEESGEVEEGDTLSGVTNTLNKIYGTSYTYDDIAKFNNISDPNKINAGQIVRIGAYDNKGNVWQPPENPNNFTLLNRFKYNKNQLSILNTHRNFYGSSAPEQIKLADEENNWKNFGEAVAHNIAGASGNIDYRGTGPRTGQQAIYNSSGDLVTNPENEGTFDFSPPTTFWGSVKHYFMDVQPWIDYGNGPTDTTTRTERNTAFRNGIKNAISNKIKSLFD